MHHFIDHISPNLEQKALLILDGNPSHKSYEALKLAKKYSVFSYGQYLTDDTEIASSGFRVMGISPFNANISPDHMFSPSLTTNAPEAVPLSEKETVNENLKDTQSPKIPEHKHI
ncbi:hypothetical protein Trydic_g17197 [Trypoxylus dichotomus]